MLKLFLRRTSAKDQKPTVTKPAAAGELAQGELWLNINHETPGLFARADDDTLLEFKPEQPFLQAGTGAKPRTINDKLRDFVNVKDFGAVGDGVANDTQAIKDALAASGRVYLPPGTYLVKETIPVSATAGIANRPMLLGAGGNTSSTTIKFAPAVAGTPLFQHEHTGTYEGIYFIGPGVGTKTGEVCFDFGSTGTQRHTIFRDCMFRYWNKAALFFSGQWNFTIDNCRFLDSGDRATPVAALTGGIVFKANTILGWSTSGMIISNCYFSGCSYGYYSEGGWNLTLINPVFEYCVYPYYRNGAGTPHVLINPWYEANGNAPISEGPVMVVGGRGTAWTGNNLTTGVSVHVASDGVALYRKGTPISTLNGAGNLAFADGQGVDFSGVAGSGANSSLLKDYEQGSWTPVVTDGTRNATHGAAISSYTKVGNIVRIRSAILNIDTTGLTPTAQIRIAGLPYVTSTTANTWQHVPVFVSDVTSPSGVIVGQIRNSTSMLMLLNQTPTGSANATVSQITSTKGDIFLDFTYVV